LSHSWTYLVNTAIGTTSTEGPVTDAQLIQLGRDGKIRRDTMLNCPARTAAGWVYASQIAPLLQAIEQGESERLQAKQQAQAQKEAQRLEAARLQDVQRQQASEVQARQAAMVATISDCKDVNLVNSICERARKILTNTETIELVAVQQKLMSITPDAIIATNRRVIFYRPKMFGQFSFEDFVWLDLGNAHIKQGMLTSEFSAQHISGRNIHMDCLTKDSASRLYRMAQEREEQAREMRRQVHMDTMRAGAMQVNVQTHVPQQVAAPVTVTAASELDPVARLTKLKSMLDAGLISTIDFEKRKQEILSGV
jgi:hypothetical protein